MINNDVCIKVWVNIKVYICHGIILTVNEFHKLIINNQKYFNLSKEDKDCLEYIELVMYKNIDYLYCNVCNDIKKHMLDFFEDIHKNHKFFCYDTIHDFYQHIFDDCRKLPKEIKMIDIPMNGTWCIGTYNYLDGLVCCEEFELDSITPKNIKECTKFLRKVIPHLKPKLYQIGDPYFG